MLNLRRSLPIALVAGLVMVASTGYAQDADADLATKQLRDGIGLFEAMEFQQAKADLLQVKRADLSDADKKILDEYLGSKLDTAIKGQLAAKTAYKDGQKAIKAGDIDDAKKCFANAAASEYIPAAMRQDAMAQLALAEAKATAAADADKATPGPEVQPIETDEAPAATSVPPAPEPEVVSVESALVPAQPAPVDVTRTAEAAGNDTLSDLATRRKLVQALIAKGRKAMEENQPKTATGYFQRALAQDPDNEQARRLLDAARRKTATYGTGGILSVFEESTIIAKQASDVDFEKALTRSSELLGRAKSKADFDAAADAAQSAQSVLNTSKSYYTDQEYRERLVRVESQQDRIARQHEEWVRLRLSMQQEEVAQAEADRVLRDEQQRERKIADLISRAQTLESEQQFAQALEVTEQILKIDPDNSYAGGRVDLLRQNVLLQEGRRITRLQKFNAQQELRQMNSAEIPWYQLLRYPSDWKELSKRRRGFEAGQLSETPEDRLVRQKLKERSPKFEFLDMEFKDAIDWIRTMAELNIVVKWNTVIEAGVEQTTPVNVPPLFDVTVEKALEIVLDDVGAIEPLGYVIDGGVITISTKGDLSSKTLTRVYDIRDLIVRIPNFSAGDISLGSGGGGGGGGSGGGFGGGGGGGGGDDGGDGGDEQSKEEIITNIIELVTETIDASSWMTAGGTVGSIRELNGQLVVTQTAGNHQSLMDLISQLRETKALQISIEARFITVRTGFLNSIGVDLDFFFNIGSPLGSTGNVIDPATGAFVPIPNSGGVSTWGPRNHTSRRVTPISGRQSSFGFADLIGTPALPGGVAGQVTSAAMSIAGTFVDDIQVDFLVEATQASESTRVLTAPRLTLFNGQRAYVTVAEQQAYVSDLEPAIGDNVVAYNTTVSQVPTGTALDVEATISADRRYVILTVRPYVSILNSFARYFTSVTEVDDAGQPLTGEGFIQLPNITVQRLETTVSVPDGGTLLLGGQRTAGEVEREMGVPILNKIPIINRLFSNRSKTKDEQTLLILIRPKIIIHREEEELQYPD